MVMPVTESKGGGEDSRRRGIGVLYRVVLRRIRWRFGSETRRWRNGERATNRGKASEVRGLEQWFGSELFSCVKDG